MCHEDDLVLVTLEELAIQLLAADGWLSALYLRHCAGGATQLRLLRELRIVLLDHDGLTDETHVGAWWERRVLLNCRLASKHSVKLLVRLVSMAHVVEADVGIPLHNETVVSSDHKRVLERSDRDSRIQSK